jgi:flagellar basal-body rod protein FlgB
VGLFDVTQIALERALSGAAERQQILANNLANANTPGFKRSDLDFHSTLAGALASGASSTQLDALSFTPQTDASTAMQADGNNVDVDTEMSNLSENSLEYQSLVAVASARLKMISTAIGMGGQ